MDVTRDPVPVAQPMVVQLGYAIHDFRKDIL